MTLLLIRHGETALNAARVMQPADTPLSAQGLAQAVALARRLRGAPLAGLVSSDLPRARQTAAAIADACQLPCWHTDTPQGDFGAALRERDFGDFRGLPHADLPWNPLESDAAPPGGESGPAFRGRVAEVFARLVALRADLPGPLAVVTHGLVIREILRSHARWPQDPSPEGPTANPPWPSRLRNTSVSILAATPPHTVLLADCIAHLGDDEQEAPLSLSGG